MLSTRPAPSRIAVIDDDSVFLELMQDLLGAGEGYDVFTCSSWLESFEFVKRTRPDLVMLDLMLGREQAGWAVLQLLRSDAETKDLPVIMCSAAVPALSRKVESSAGGAATETLGKPFDVDHLLHTIERLLVTATKETTRDPIAR